MSRILTGQSFFQFLEAAGVQMPKDVTRYTIHIDRDKPHALAILECELFLRVDDKLVLDPETNSIKSTTKRYVLQEIEDQPSKDGNA